MYSLKLLMSGNACMYTYSYLTFLPKNNLHFKDSNYVIISYIYCYLFTIYFNGGNPIVSIEYIRRAQVKVGLRLERRYSQR